MLTGKPLSLTALWTARRVTSTIEPRTTTGNVQCCLNNAQKNKPQNKAKVVGESKVSKIKGASPSSTNLLYIAVSKIANDKNANARVYRPDRGECRTEIMQLKATNKFGIQIENRKLVLFTNLSKVKLDIDKEIVKMSASINFFDSTMSKSEECDRIVRPDAS